MANDWSEISVHYKAHVTAVLEVCARGLEAEVNALKKSTIIAESGNAGSFYLKADKIVEYENKIEAYRAAQEALKTYTDKVEADTQALERLRLDYATLERNFKESVGKIVDTVSEAPTEDRNGG